MTSRPFVVSFVVGICIVFPLRVGAESFTTNIISGVSTNVVGSYTVGNTGSLNYLGIYAGGSLTNTDGIIGNQSGADQNAVLVKDAGSSWNNNFLDVGVTGSVNRLTIQNGGRVNNGGVEIGGATVSSNNTVLVTGTNSVWATDGDFNLGVNGPNNSLIITNGGQVLSGPGPTDIGYYVSSSNNQALVTGTGSLWNVNSTFFNIGYGSTGNSLTVEKGGSVTSGLTYIGANSDGNTVTISDPGSLWINQGDIVVGGAGSGNQLLMQNGAAVQTWNLYVGDSASFTNNALNISNGSLVVSNGVGTGVLDVRQGTLTLNGGSVTVDSLVITNTLGQLAFQDGALATMSTMYANGQEFSVGTGNGVSTLSLSGGSHVFSNGFAIADASTSTGAVWITSSNVMIRGDHTIIGNSGVGQMTVSNGTVTADPTYGFIVGSTSGSQGTLTIAGGSVTGNLCLACGSSSTGAVWVTGGQFSSEPMDIGDGGVGQMTVSNGTVTSGSTYSSVVGNSPSSVGTLTVAGGNMLLSGTLLLASESGATGVVWVAGGQLNVSQLTIGASGQGMLTLSNGTITVTQLAVTNGLSSVLNLIGGTLNTASTVLQNNYQFLVGDGIHSANFHLLGGVHSFANGLRITSNSLLTGCGTINGSVEVDPGGTILADCGGTLTFTGIVTNNGTMRAINGSVLEGYDTVVNNGTIDITDGTTNFDGAFINNGTIIGGPSSAFQITAIVRQRYDILVTWTCEGGKSYVLQSTKRAAIASYTTNFADVSPVIFVSGVGASTTNYLDVGSAYAPMLTPPSGNIVTTSGVPSTVSISADNTRGITDSLGQALPIGSLLMLGTFSMSEPTIQSNFFAGNVAAIMSNFTPYSTSFAVGDGTGLPASWDVSRSAAGFGGQQIYLLAIDKPTFAPASHLGIFTAPSWVFPAGGGTNTIALEDVTDFVIGAQGGSLTINLPLGGETYTFSDTARLSVLPGRILFYRVRLAQ